MKMETLKVFVVLMKTLVLIVVVKDQIVNYVHQLIWVDKVAEVVEAAEVKEVVKEVVKKERENT